jgi:hypothetical protein
MTPNPKSNAEGSNPQIKKTGFSLKTFSNSSANPKSKQQIEGSGIFKGPSFRCYENKEYFKNRQEMDSVEETERNYDSDKSYNDEHEIEISMEMTEELEDRSINIDQFKTKKDESSASDINLSSLKQSHMETSSWKTKQKVEKEQKGSKTSNHFSGSKTGKSTIRDESEDITLTIVTNSQQLSSQMNLRPSIQFMNQNVTDDFQLSDNAGSPFVNQMKAFMGESLKNPTEMNQFKSPNNHKFSYSEDLTNIFNQINNKNKEKKMSQRKQMETICDIEDQVDDPNSPKFMKMEFFRTLGEDEEDSNMKGDRSKSVGKVDDLPSQVHSSNEHYIKKERRDERDGWGSEDEFVDKSKFLNSTNFRSSRQMI